MGFRGSGVPPVKVAVVLQLSFPTMGELTAKGVPLVLSCVSLGNGANQVKCFLPIYLLLSLVVVLHSVLQLFKCASKFPLNILFYRQFLNHCFCWRMRIGAS